MFNGYFIQALQEEFYRVYGYDARMPVITEREQQDIHNFGIGYLMGPLHYKDDRP